MIGQTEIGVRLELHQFRFRLSAIVSVRKLVQFEPDTNCSRTTPLLTGGLGRRWKCLGSCSAAGCGTLHSPGLPSV
jgi:hypothetical protein